jgi:hypothetical protein
VTILVDVDIDQPKEIKNLTIGERQCTRSVGASIQDGIVAQRNRHIIRQKVPHNLPRSSVDKHTHSRDECLELVVHIFEQSGVKALAK